LISSLFKEIIAFIKTVQFNPGPDALAEQISGLQTLPQSVRI
jgi:hypothetical protein